MWMSTLILCTLSLLANSSSFLLISIWWTRCVKGAQNQWHNSLFQREAQICWRWFYSFLFLASGTERFSHLHLQHLVEDGLGQAFPDVSLVGSLDQRVSVLLVRNDAPAPGDLRTTSGLSRVPPTQTLTFQTEVTDSWLIRDAKSV